MILPPPIASSISRTELSRATASGMKELGNNTVSRSGRIGSSGGIDNGRSAAATSSAGRFSSWSLIVNLAMQNADPQSAFRNPKSDVSCAGGEELGSATGGAPGNWDAGCLHVEEQRGAAATRSLLPLFLLGVLVDLFAIVSGNRERSLSE